MALVDVRDNSEHRERHAVFFPCTNGCSSPVKCPLPGKLKDCSGSMTASPPCRPNGRTQAGCSRLVCAFVCLRQPHGILAPKDIKAAFRCEVRHAKVRGPG